MEVVKIRVWIVETPVTFRKWHILLTKLSYT